MGSILGDNDPPAHKVTGLPVLDYTLLVSMVPDLIKEF